MIPVQVCQFCQQPTQYAPLPLGKNFALNRIKTLRIHFCFQCKAEYVYWTDDGALAAVHLYTTVNGKMYRWSTSPSDKLGRLWYVEKPGIPGEQVNEGVVLLKDFQDYSEITPSNIEEKISFMLPFL